MDNELKAQQYDTAFKQLGDVLTAVGVQPALTMQGRLLQILTKMEILALRPCPHLREQGGNTWCDYPGAEPADYVRAK